MWTDDQLANGLLRVRNRHHRQAAYDRPRDSVGAMSCNLFMRPMATDKEGVGGPTLRDALDGEFGLPCTLDHDSEPFIRGLAAANITGARQLLEAIAEHGCMYVWKEC